MSERNDGGPAFPTENAHQTGNTTWLHEGMTLRDYFAAKALSGLMGRRWEDASGSVPDDILDRWALAAYSAADAMLKARNA